MSDTPRTDEAQFGTERVSVSFARQLERELNAANELIKRLEEAGPAGFSTVSTEDRQEQLRRMKQREAAIWRELEIYLPIVDTMKTALSNLEEEIKRLEREVEG